eukprot:2558335-Rhodomonas_salina.1
MKCIKEFTPLVHDCVVACAQRVRTREPARSSWIAHVLKGRETIDHIAAHGSIDSLLRDTCQTKSLHRFFNGIDPINDVLRVGLKVTFKLHDCKVVLPCS